MQSMTRPRVLVVDEDAETRELIEFVLVRAAGHEVTTCAGGWEGLREYDRAQLLDQPFDVILVGMELGGMSGCEFAEQIRRYRGDAATPIHLLSEFHGDPEAQRCAELMGETRALTTPDEILELPGIIESSARRMSADAVHA